VGGGTIHGGHGDCDLLVARPERLAGLGLDVTAERVFAVSAEIEAVGEVGDLPGHAALRVAEEGGARGLLDGLEGGRERETDAEGAGGELFAKTHGRKVSL